MRRPVDLGALPAKSRSGRGRDRRQFERDRTRDAELVAIGYVVLRFTYRAIVQRRRREAERIRRIIQQWAPHLLVAA